MLYCRYCDFLKTAQKIEDNVLCNLHLCEFADFVLSNESIDDLSNPPCYSLNKETKK